MLTCARNHKVVVYKRYECDSPIKLRKSLIKDIPAIEVARSDPMKEVAYAKWWAEGRILYTSDNPRWSGAPPVNDAIYFCEAPIGFSFFETLIGNTRSEAVVFRPPSWQLHQETIDRICPDVSLLKTLATIAKAHHGRALDKRDLDCIAQTKIPVKHASVIYMSDITPLCSTATNRQVRSALKWLRWNVGIFKLYRLMGEPAETFNKTTYAILEALPKIDGGWSIRSFNRPLNGLDRGHMGLLTRSGCIQHGPDVFVIDTRLRGLDWTTITALNNARRADWWKMQTIVDNSPEIPNA